MAGDNGQRFKKVYLQQNGSILDTKPPPSQIASAVQPGTLEQPSMPIAEFVQHLEDYTPLLPDMAIANVVANTGLSVEDVRLTRFISSAGHKFISDIATSAMLEQKARRELERQNQADGGTDKKVMPARKPVSNRACLKVTDLDKVLSEQGITLTKPPYRQSK